MKFDIVCCTCKQVKLGEVIFPDDMHPDDALARSQDMGRCEACQAAIEAQAQDAED